MTGDYDFSDTDPDIVSDTPRRTRSTKIFAACLLAALAIVGGAIVACLVS